MYREVIRWKEVWTDVDTFGVERWVEEWEAVTMVEIVEDSCLAAQKFAHAVRLPTGRNFLAMIKEFFTIQPKK